MIAAVPIAFAQGTLFTAQRARIDSAVTAVLASTGAPSASIAVVWDGKIVYEHAYGSARLAPPMPATNTMRYSIGSVSKLLQNRLLLSGGGNEELLKEL